MSGNFNVLLRQLHVKQRYDIHRGNDDVRGRRRHRVWNGTGTGLVIASGATWSGTFGIYGGVAGASVLNQGTLDHTGGSSYIYGQGYAGYTFTNSGTVSSSGGGWLNMGSRR